MYLEEHARSERTTSSGQHFLQVALAAFVFGHASRSRLGWTRGHYSTRESSATHEMWLCQLTPELVSVHTSHPSTPPPAVLGICRTSVHICSFTSACRFVEGGKNPHAAPVEFLPSAGCLWQTPSYSAIPHTPHQRMVSKRATSRRFVGDMAMSKFGRLSSPAISCSMSRAEILFASLWIANFNGQTFHHQRSSHCHGAVYFCHSHLP